MMNEADQNGNRFVGYEYKNVMIKHSMADLYTDCLPSFGWALDKITQSLTPSSVTMKFKRDRKIINKAELTRLQREFESRMNEINKLETSKWIGASTAAYIVGIAGTACMAGSVFAVTSGMIPLCIILAIPALIGYFLYRRIRDKKTQEVTPFIDEQYDTVYSACEKAGSLLYK